MIEVGRPSWAKRSAKVYKNRSGSDDSRTLFVENEPSWRWKTWALDAGNSDEQTRNPTERFEFEMFRYCSRLICLTTVFVEAAKKPYRKASPPTEYFEHSQDKAPDRESTPLGNSSEAAHMSRTLTTVNHCTGLWRCPNHAVIVRS